MPSHTDPEPSFDEELSKALTTNPDDLPTDKTSSKSSPVVDNSSHTDLRAIADKLDYYLSANYMVSSPRDAAFVSMQMAELIEPLITQRETTARKTEVDRALTYKDGFAKTDHNLIMFLQERAIELAALHLDPKGDE